MVTVIKPGHKLTTLVRTFQEDDLIWFVRPDGTYEHWARIVLVCGDVAQVLRSMDPPWLKEPVGIGKGFWNEIAPSIRARVTDGNQSSARAVKVAIRAPDDIRIGRRSSQIKTMDEFKSSLTSLPGGD